MAVGTTPGQRRCGRWWRWKRYSFASSDKERLAFQKQMRSLEGQRNNKRRALFDAQDEIDRKREQLISEIEGKMGQKTVMEPLFSIRWQML